jgi:hypothetical protein
MPGLDFVMSALARAGLFRMATTLTAPTTNQAITLWLRPSTPAWVAEGVVFLWNANTATYEPATPELWLDFLAVSGNAPYIFQSATGASNTVDPGTTLIAVQRAAPASTLITLPSLTDQGPQAVKVVDWSTGVTSHSIFVSTPDGATIMKQVTWEMISTASQFAGATFQPCPELNAWIIAP